MHAPGVRHPLTLRAGTSDLDVFHQIFIQKEYADLDAMDNVQLVIDCGAYIGCSAVYFLSRFPQCHLIAVEPNSENFNLLNRNLAPYADRVTLIHAGVWSHTTRLKMSSDVYRDGLHWSGQVCPCADGDPDGFQAVDLTSLLRDSGQERISILKMDIEGAESLVFSKGDRSWIDKVDAIAIELHEDSSFGPASPIFFEAIKTQNFMVSTRGELTICRRKVGQ